MAEEKFYSREQIDRAIEAIRIEQAVMEKQAEDFFAIMDGEPEMDEMMVFYIETLDKIFNDLESLDYLTRENFLIMHTSFIKIYNSQNHE
jgi:hypothetical protein